MRNLNKIYSVFSLVMMTCLMGFIPINMSKSNAKEFIKESDINPCELTVWTAEYLNGDQYCKSGGSDQCYWCI